MALLAAYMRKGDGRNLEEFLSECVFADCRSVTVEPEEEDIKGFREFLARYRAGLAAEKAAVESVR